MKWRYAVQRPAPPNNQFPSCVTHLFIADVGLKEIYLVYPSIHLLIDPPGKIKHGIWTFLLDAGFIQVLMGNIFDYRKVSIRLLKMIHLSAEFPARSLDVPGNGW